MDQVGLDESEGPTSGEDTSEPVRASEEHSTCKRLKKLSKRLTAFILEFHFEDLKKNGVHVRQLSYMYGVVQKKIPGLKCSERS